MNLEPFDEEDGYRVWLDQGEVANLLSRCEGQKEELAITLGVRSGLRASEIVAVEAQHVVETSAGPRVRVFDSKGKQYRETPTTESVRSTANTYAELQGDDARLVPHSKRWVQRHVDRITDELAAADDEMWAHVTPHDLRRTWATSLAGSEVDPLLVCDWGGWSDLETFLEHYRGTYSPEVQRRELEKVGWLSDGGAMRGAADADPDGWVLET
ncbi:site-specific integrase [Halorubrum ezzemoulense]|uniref:Site-specific integrase n=1 Tax=Halorubrum ezzemoulense TaxID=337243 RepID=A0ABT4Z6N1_HALEZ|nr:site-specific integrase [Halorubrum ezzemoulense]MDB2293714.1 site-specific integrase [Halorubrum ezzemoulense]